MRDGKRESRVIKIIMCFDHRANIYSTAYHSTSRYGHRQCLRWLVQEAGADMALHAANDSDVFAWAVFGGDLPTLQTVAELLPPGALHHRNKFGCTVPCIVPRYRDCVC